MKFMAFRTVSKVTSVFPERLSDKSIQKVFFFFFLGDAFSVCKSEDI